MVSKHPWQAKIGVGIVMLILAFFGLVISDLRSGGGWIYWMWIVPVYAMLALWLSWYVRRQEVNLSPITLGHEVLHWIGVIISVFMVSFLVNHGIVSRFNAGVFNLILLSLGVFIAGVYIEPTFLLIGIVLGIMSLATALLVQYMYALMVPVLIGSALIIALMVWIKHKKFQNPK